MVSEEGNAMERVRGRGRVEGRVVRGIDRLQKLALKFFLPLVKRGVCWRRKSPFFPFWKNNSYIRIIVFSHLRM
jgi:hypothetical protein